MGSMDFDYNDRKTPPTKVASNFRAGAQKEQKGGGPSGRAGGEKKGGKKRKVRLEEAGLPYFSLTCSGQEKKGRLRRGGGGGGDTPPDQNLCKKPEEEGGTAPFLGVCSILTSYTEEEVPPKESRHGRISLPCVKGGEAIDRY